VLLSLMVLSAEMSFQLSASRSRICDSARPKAEKKILTKESLLSDFKSGEHRLVSLENGPMEVQVPGNVAVAQASVTEKRIQGGKDISGQFVFMDLLEKRAGKWVSRRTFSARVGREI
jgi:hypothetical protein